jgi:hypothetical protein
VMIPLIYEEYRLSGLLEETTPALPVNV